MDFKGYSVAGQTTSIVFQNQKICFDIAQGLPFNLSAKFYCLSHLHADHGAGLNYLLSQRSLFGLPAANIMLPASTLESVDIILKEWMKIEGFQFSYNLIPAEAGMTYDLSDQWRLRSFPTTHRVPSFGYILYRKKKKLKAEFIDKDRQQILDAKSRGETIEDDVETPYLAFTGDTQIEFLKAHPDVTKAKLLFMECTYWDDKKPVAAAREWGHIHWQEILDHLDAFSNQHVSLIHVSARHSTKQVEDILQSSLPHATRSRFSIFPRPM